MTPSVESDELNPFALFTASPSTPFHLVDDEDDDEDDEDWDDDDDDDDDDDLDDEDDDV
jgi:hypothetical protein